jgi:hypothetical protein
MPPLFRTSAISRRVIPTPPPTTTSIVNNATGGTSGTAVTVANSGGTGDTAWNAVNINSPGSIVFDNTATRVPRGMGYKFTQGATLAAQVFKWNSALSIFGLTTNQRFLVRFYYSPSYSVPTGSIRLFDILGGTTLLAGVSHSSTSGVGIRAVDTAGIATGVGQGSSMSAGSLYRVELDFNGVGGGTGVGTSTIRVYLGTTTTLLGPAETLTARNYGTVAPTQVEFGSPSASGQASSSYWLSQIYLATSGTMPDP